MAKTVVWRPGWLTYFIVQAIQNFFRWENLCIWALLGTFHFCKVHYWIPLLPFHSDNKELNCFDCHKTCFRLIFSPAKQYNCINNKLSLWPHLRIFYPYTIKFLRALGKNLSTWSCNTHKKVDTNIHYSQTSMEKTLFHFSKWLTVV